MAIGSAHTFPAASSKATALRKRPAAANHTFPVMAGSSFVRMSDEQVLPLQYLNIFFLSKGLIERQAQH